MRREDQPNDYSWGPIVESTVTEAGDIADYDAYLDNDVLLPQNGEHMHAARVIGPAKDEDIQLKGK